MQWRHRVEDVTRRAPASIAAAVTTAPVPERHRDLTITEPGEGSSAPGSAGATVVKAVAELVASEIDVEAWVLDDTGFPKDGKDSPGVKRQYSGHWARQVTVRSAFPCTLSEGAGRCRWDGRCISRRTGAWMSSGGTLDHLHPELRLGLETQPHPGSSPCAAGWDVPKAPVLGDHAYGENTWLRDRLDRAGSTIAEFRKRHEAALADLFSSVLSLCKEAGLVKVG